MRKAHSLLHGIVYKERAAVGMIGYKRDRRRIGNNAIALIKRGFIKPAPGIISIKLYNVRAVFIAYHGHA